VSARWFASRIFVVIICGLASIQRMMASDITELWPEIDLYLKLGEYARLFFQTQSTRDDRDVHQVKLGTYMDFYLKPIKSLRDKDEKKTDAARTRPLLFRIGYNYIPSTNSATEQRIVMELSPRFPLLAGIVAIVRNGGDFRFINGGFSTRYRNRLTLERLFKAGAWHITPYARIEETFDTRYGKWNSTAVAEGAVFAWKKHWEVEAYLQHQNDTSKPPNLQINGLGLKLVLSY
jgi:hypothetical protein